MPSRICAVAAFCFVLLLGSRLPALAGPPFITDDPEPVELGHWEVYGFTAGASGHGDTTGLGPSLEVNYGAAPGLQLHLITGMAYDAQPGGRVLMGPSDTELGAKLRFIDPGEDDWYPQVGVFPLVEAPTGNANRGLGAGYWDEFLPLWIQKDLDSPRPDTAHTSGKRWTGVSPSAQASCAPTGAIAQRS